MLYTSALLTAAPAVASPGAEAAGEMLAGAAATAEGRAIAAGTMPFSEGVPLPFLADHGGFTLAAMAPALSAEPPPGPAGQVPVPSGGTGAALSPQSGPDATERERVRRIRRETMRVEVAYHVVSLIDGIATDRCLRKQTCREVNPIYGSNPSTLRIFGTKLAFGAVHQLVVMALLDRDPGLARGFAYVSLVLQGGVTGLTLSRAY